MCKFTNRLFVFAVMCVLLFVNVAAKPLRRSSFRARNDMLGGGGSTGISTAALLELLQPEYEYDYDLHYDQRQKGFENIRVKLDGVVIEVPQRESKQPPEASSTAYHDLMEFVAQELLGDWLNTDAKLNGKPNKKWVVGLSENSASTTSTSITERDEKPTELIVEIPASKKDQSSATQEHDQPQMFAIADDSPNWPRTKGHLKGLLSWLNQKRRQ